MYEHASDFADNICRQLQDDGYSVHQGRTDDGPELAGKHWTTWMKPGMSDAEVAATMLGLVVNAAAKGAPIIPE
jgi:hypothetical protein